MSTPTQCPSFAVSSSGMLVGWRAKYGAAFAHFASTRALTADLSEYRMDADGQAAAIQHGERVWLAADSAEGVYVADGTSDVRLVLPGARGATWAAMPGTLYVAGVTSRGVEIKDVGESPDTEPLLISPRRDARHLSMVATQAGVVAVFALDDDAFGVVLLRAGKPTEVRHRLRRRAEGLHAVGVRGRVGVAISYGDEQVDLAVLARDGTVRERPHEILRGGAYSDPQVVFEETGFAVGACDRASGEVSVKREGGGRERRFEGVSSSFRLAYFRGKLLCASVAESTDAVEEGLRLWTLEKGQRASETHIPMTPYNRAFRVRVLGARDLVARVGSRWVGQGYRGASPGSVDSRAHSGTLEGEARKITWRITVGEQATRLLIRAGEVETERVGSLVRLARWMKRGGRAAREAAESDLRWASEIVEGSAEVIRSTRGAGTIDVEIALNELPEAAILLQWLHGFASG